MSRGRLRPSMEDAFISVEMISDPSVMLLSDLAFAALMRLVMRSGVASVWTYTEPDPKGRLPSDDKSMARLAGLSKAKWREVKPELEQFFAEDGDHWALNRPWVLVRVGVDRPAISAALRSMVMRRDKFTCVYCGSKAGPFDCDHIVPVAQGGATEPDNLVCACASCNRSKSNRRPEEWVR